MSSQTPISLDYAQVAATADEEAAAICAAIDFRKPVSELLRNEEAAARIAARLPAVFLDKYGRSSCGGNCVFCNSPTAEVLTIAWQCELAAWHLRNRRHVSVDSASAVCVACADRLCSRIAKADRLIWLSLVIVAVSAVILFLMRHGWIALLFAAVAIAIGVSRYDTLRTRLPDSVHSRFPSWVRWTGIRGYSLAAHPLNRLTIDFSKDPD